MYQCHTVTPFGSWPYSPSDKTRACLLRCADKPLLFEILKIGPGESRARPFGLWAQAYPLGNECHTVTRSLLRCAEQASLKCKAMLAALRSTSLVLKA